MTRKRYYGLMLDGPRAGKWIENPEPVARIAVQKRLETRDFNVGDAAPEMVPFEVVYLVHAKVGDVGFWIDEGLADASGLPTDLYIIRRLANDFRPRAADPEQRYREAIDEVRAAKEALMRG